MFKFEKLTKNIFQYTIACEKRNFKIFSILQMLGIVTYVYGHQESIVPISLTLNAKNGWFKVDVAIF